MEKVKEFAACAGVSVPGSSKPPGAILFQKGLEFSTVIAAVDADRNAGRGFLRLSLFSFHGLSLAARAIITDFVGGRHPV